MKVGVQIPGELVVFLDDQARRHDTPRSGFLPQLIEAERVRKQVQEYLDCHGWDVAEDDTTWRAFQRRRIAKEYRDDDWSTAEISVNC